MLASMLAGKHTLAPAIKILVILLLSMFCCNFFLFQRSESTSRTREDLYCKAVSVRVSDFCFC